VSHLRLHKLLLQQRRRYVVRYALVFLQALLIQLRKRKVVTRNSVQLRLPPLLLLLKLWGMAWLLLRMRMPLR
jgi:hypothetical protein